MTQSDVMGLGAAPPLRLSLLGAISLLSSAASDEIDVFDKVTGSSRSVKTGTVYHRRFQRPATDGQEVSRGVSTVVQRVREFAAALRLALNGH